tara:strand:- start:256 stop:561 length:306 start_codon:yes stop_codon:yes gene_type:complete
MTTLKILENLNQFEQEKLCDLLECDTVELVKLYENANKVYENADSMYDSLLKILQQGNNIREATFIGILCGQLIGFSKAQENMEREIKDKLFNAFKNQKPF